MPSKAAKQVKKDSMPTEDVATSDVSMAALTTSWGPNPAYFLLLMITTENGDKVRLSSVEEAKKYLAAKQPFLDHIDTLTIDEEPNT
ncbi:Down syndrome cell adhesion molecule-like protein Dscam2 [Dissostichus eleginoides]|uniref:Down syndrome cell adhesion molecule-like protein Dscam2 n=1 Tax=Dissostichus eleginoides TaxID=100907 RepID=A0AAD9CH92_DISEL|nr:Down syndrome cell adhesion molecule-like protein Dscam2 [Dissostichus eleginoides]